jgi:hypothetical protein
VKVVVIGVLVVFVGFWMVQSPDSLADFTREGVTWIWDTTQTIFESLIDFLGNVFK